jgi:hypothetical protein
MGQIRTSATAAAMSASYAKAVVSGLKTDIAALRSAIAGKPDINFPSRDVRK